ncbi:transposase family protein [Amycolatopsis eburnea]
MPARRWRKAGPAEGQGLPSAGRQGRGALVDGTPIRTRRRTGKANRANYNGKHRHHGLVMFAMTDKSGRLLWVSVADPGTTARLLRRG